MTRCFADRLDDFLEGRRFEHWFDVRISEAETSGKNNLAIALSVLKGAMFVACRLLGFLLALLVGLPLFWFCIFVFFCVLKVLLICMPYLLAAGLCWSFVLSCKGKTCDAELLAMFVFFVFLLWYGLARIFRS